MSCLCCVELYMCLSFRQRQINALMDEELKLLLGHQEDRDGSRIRLTSRGKMWHGMLQC